MQQFEKDGVELRNAIERIERQLASPANIEGLRDQEFWFDNLVENGTFDSGASWGYGSGWTIGSGVASSSLDGSFLTHQEQSFVGLERAHIAFDVLSYVSGTVRLYQDGFIGIEGSSNGVVSGHFAVLQNAVQFYSSAFVGSIDNVRAFESDGTNIIHRMPTGWKPRRVFVDGVLQREGATHDYEIKQDPEGYYIVPAVAPGANTETCILGVRT